MSQTIERKQGAVKFTKPKPRPSSQSHATLFSEHPLDCVDSNWDSVIEKIESFRMLEDDWDGNHSAPPSHELIAMAIGLATELKEISQPSPERVVAGVNGTILLEYCGSPFTEIEIVSSIKAEVFEDGRLVSSLHATEDV